MRNDSAVGRSARRHPETSANDITERMPERLH